MPRVRPTGYDAVSLHASEVKYRSAVDTRTLGTVTPRGQHPVLARTPRLCATSVVSTVPYVRHTQNCTPVSDPGKGPAGNGMVYIFCGEGRGRGKPRARARRRISGSCRTRVSRLATVCGRNGPYVVQVPSTQFLLRRLLNAISTGQVANVVSLAKYKEIPQAEIDEKRMVAFVVTLLFVTPCYFYVVERR